tara:strand:+ start:955 stop:1143 length:189 start_codon:yes stop_codon:yes gene_type:complete
MMAASRSGVEVVATGGLVVRAGAWALVDAWALADGDFDLRPNIAMDGLRKRRDGTQGECPGR